MSCLVLGLLLSAATHTSAQAAQAQGGTAAPVDKNAAGDTAELPGPMASDLSSELTPHAIHKAMGKVADWQIGAAQSRFNQQWTYAALYDGLLETSRSTGNPAYRDAVLQTAEGFHWELNTSRFGHADDEALGRAYLELYLEHQDAVRLAHTRDGMDKLIARPDDPKKNLWWWCDALFMAPPVLSQLAAITHDKKYLDFMDHEYWLTYASLYDPQEHLFFRDDWYLARREANGSKLFWSRGNGWVLAGLASVLQTMPAEYPTRGKYLALLQEMATRVAGLQQTDGLWRSGLLDPGAYTQPEVSGSAFFTYAMAWGVNAGILDRKTYLPVITAAWRGMLQHIYRDGRLGSIQPIDASPGQFQPSSSYVYGVGAFLLAGSEIAKLEAKPTAPRAHPHKPSAHR